MTVCADRMVRIRERTETILLTDVCTIYAPPVASAADKGEAPGMDYPDDWTVFAAAVPCRVVEARLSGAENQQAGAIASEKAYDVLVPATTARPSAKYRIRITSQGSRDLEITHPVKTTEMSLMKIECKETR